MSEAAAKHRQTFIRALQEGDARTLWGISAEVFPHLPGLNTLEQATQVMHRARTEVPFVSDKGRCYSHRWLEDRGLPSALPERLKAKADQFYPKPTPAVGLSVNLSKTIGRMFPGLAQEIEDSMNGAVLDLHADGADLNDRPLVHGLMFERRERRLKQLGVRTNADAR